MIEGLFIDRGDVFSPPSMFGVAFFAFLLFLQPPMESEFVVNVCSNVLMTIKAKPGLCGLVESLMALGTVLFPFRVSCDHLAGHQCFLYAVGAG